MSDDKLRILISSIKEIYGEEAAKEPSTATLIYGLNRTGKTHALTTARRPILIHSFDPGGLELPAIQKGINEGWILAEPFEEGTPRRIVPSVSGTSLADAVYTRWATRFMEELEAGLFGLLGTYVLDTGTSMVAATLSQVAVQFGRKEGAPTEKDYKFANKRLYDFVHTVVAELPCDFILNCHVYSWTDKDSKKTLNDVSLPWAVRHSVMNAMHEIYLARSERTSSGQKYWWQTASDKDFFAGSRLSGGKLSFKEPQDFKAILKKLGRRHEDAPPLDI